MKKLAKKGFSMIELLFVMVIIATLSAIAIPSFKSDASILTSMKSDARNVITQVQTTYVENQNYTDAAGTYTDEDEDGFAQDLMNDQNVAVSKGNTIFVTAIDCNGVTDGDGCFTIDVRNEEIDDKAVQFNSETKGSIFLNDNL